LRVPNGQEIHTPSALDIHAGREKSDQSGQKYPGPHTTENKNQLFLSSYCTVSHRMLMSLRSKSAASLDLGLEQSGSTELAEVLALPPGRERDRVRVPSEVDVPPRRRRSASLPILIATKGFERPICRPGR